MKSITDIEKKERFADIERRAAIAIRHGMTRDRFWAIMCDLHGYEIANHGLERYDEIAEFLKEAHHD